MKCRYTFTVGSRAILDPPVRFSHRGWDFSLEAEKGRFCRLVVEISGVKFPEFPRIENPPGSSMPHFKIPIDPMRAVVQREIRAARGALVLWGVHAIETESPKSEWIPETTVEHDSTDILGISMQRTPRDSASVSKAALDMVVRCFLSRQRFVPHEIPFEFYRRGDDDMYHERYIEAIYDFYFVFEYLFGQGKFSKRAVCDAFSRSPKCRAAITKGQKEPFGNVTDKPRVHRAFHDKYYTKTVDEVIDTVVTLRGFLHHQSLTRPNNWNPGTQEEFEADAIFLQRASFEAIMELSNDILFEPQELATFHSTPIYGPGNIRINWHPMP